MNKPILYLIMRNDLPSLNPGKLAAQAAHCANAFVKWAQKHDRRLLQQWERQSGNGFGTTIVLGAPVSFLSLVPLAHQVVDDTYPCELPMEIASALDDDRVVISGTRAFFLRPELVGAFMFSTERPMELRDLELYP